VLTPNPFVLSEVEARWTAPFDFAQGERSFVPPLPVRAERSRSTFVPLSQRPQAVIPFVALGGGHLFREVHTLQTRPFARLLLQGFEIEFSLGVMRDHAVGGAVQADRAGQSAGVDARQADAAIALQPGVEMLGAAEIGRIGHVLADDATQGVRVDRLDILGIGADIADMREGKIDDLARIRGIGHHFLIAGHRGIEADLAHRRALGAESLAPDDSTIA